MMFAYLLYRMRKEGLIGADGICGFGLAAACEMAGELLIIGMLLLK